MEKRIPYYVSKKNVFTWLAALSLLLSSVVRCINYYSGYYANPSAWVDLIIPVIACIWLLLNLLFDGEEHYYRTSLPVLLMAVYFCIVVISSSISVKWKFIACVAYIAVAFIYRRMSEGKENKALITIILLAATAVAIWIKKGTLMEGLSLSTMRELPDILALLGGLFSVLAAGVHLDNRYHPTWGDRPDGRKLRTLDPITIVANYIMPTRNGAANHINVEIETSNLDAFISRKRKEGYKGLGMMHIFIAAYIRCVAKFPGVNRFLSGQQVYQRDDDIKFCLAVKADMALDGQETITMIHFKPTDTIKDVYEKLNEEITRIKNEKVGESTFDKTAKYFSLIPGVLFKFTIWLIRVLDYFGLLPKALLEVSCFHGSIFLTSMASLGIEPITHHLYDFGNLPVFLALGKKTTRTEVDDEGKPVRRSYISYSFNTDERIVDGFYYASVLKEFKKLLAHPERLEQPPEEVIRDID